MSDDAPRHSIEYCGFLRPRGWDSTDVRMMGSTAVSASGSDGSAIPDDDDMTRLLSELEPEEEHRLIKAVREGKAAPRTDLAALAVAVARRKKRLTLLELPVPIALTFGVAFIVSFLLEERNWPLFIFMLIFGGSVAIGGAWWGAMWRPIQRAEAVNLAICQATAPPPQPLGHLKLWLQSAVGAWMVLAIVGLAVAPLVQIPNWVGIPIYIASVVLVAWALHRRRSDRDQSS